MKRVLFLSNGHGEDLNASQILISLKHAYPTVEVAAMPIVGEGTAYRRLEVPVISPTRTLPSGGIFYMNLLNLVKDVGAGLVYLTWQQIQAVRNYSRNCDLIVAAGDVVVLAFARLAGRPYAAFIVSTSSYYEGKLRLPWLTQKLLQSSRCQVVFTRDAFTAEDLQQRGLKKAVFAGYPIMDTLTPAGIDLQLLPDVPMLALLPGSRFPEAGENLALLLKLCRLIARLLPVQFRVAFVSGFSEEKLKDVATQAGWRYEGQGKLEQDGVIVQGFWGAIAEILQQSDLVLGMAGTAVEQAVGLGKPVIQIPGNGPQFTYRFAEAQMRLLGTSVQTVDIESAAVKVKETLQDKVYLQSCIQNGKERVGTAGGSAKIAHHLAIELGL